MNIAVINLWPIWGNCVLCGVDTPLGYSAPMYEGKIVDPEKTDEWAGQVICKSCYNKLNKSEEEMDLVQNPHGEFYFKLKEKE